MIENFKVGGLKKYGLDYESLKAVNPKLIYCSITGFGQTGPYAQRAGYDFMIQGMGGIMSITGQPDGAAGAEPVKAGVAFADIFTGLYATIGILAALSSPRPHRPRPVSRPGAARYARWRCSPIRRSIILVGGKAPRRLGNAHPNIVPYQTFATKDGHIIIAVGNDRQFREYCTIDRRASSSPPIRALRPIAPGSRIATPSSRF